MSTRKNWCYTLNNYESRTQTEVLTALCQYHVFGFEVGESGTPHIQGYISLIKPCRMPALKALLPTAHWEPSKGTTTQNYNYCTKDKDFVEQGERPLEKGAAGALETRRRHLECIQLAKNGQFEEIADKYPSEYLRYHGTIKRIRQDHPDKNLQTSVETTGIWIYGPSGAGKSRLVRETYPGAYLKPVNKWWDGYQEEEIVLIEDVDKKHVEFLGYHLKIWADHYPFPAESKGSTIKIRPKKIFITSQYPIAELFPDAETRTALERRYLELFLVASNIEIVKARII